MSGEFVFVVDSSRFFQCVYSVTCQTVRQVHMRDARARKGCPVIVVKDFDVDGYPSPLRLYADSILAFLL